ncbi:DUF913-domain-containing protein [Microstroma glucosiphilum]|uniref:DUF913-domain-containing protein n=1 Tax=Pseudomicrostroma glucosiphilum TaxID=1684307 RepID=A0A316UBC2_9BASI|nr:DUF913-domain-containing protein [Pseudomicrostroma glucosiphilum]PWN22154.1 DUF913-domain-containing protein [Pseudomicrostroma glucosiphilum]
MKITKTPKRLAEASPEVKSLLDKVSAVSDDELPIVLDQVSEWCWPRGDLHYWTGVLNRFDDILAATCKEYDLAKTVHAKEFTTDRKKMLVSILRFSRLLIENCTNRKLYDSYDHLNDLLLCRDIDVLEATIRLILRPAQQYSSQSVGRLGPSISQSRLATLALTWSPRDHGLDMVSMARPDAAIPEELLGVRFQFYRRNTSSGGSQSVGASAAAPEAGPSRSHVVANGATTTPARSSSAVRRDRPTPAASASVASGLVAPSGEQSASAPEEGLTTITIKSVPALNKDPSTILRETVEEYKVPPEDHFELYLKIRLAASMSDPQERQRLLVCRLLAVACYSHITPEPLANVQLFLYEPDIVQKAAALAEVDSGLDEAIKSAALYALDALGRFKSKLSEVLSSVSASVNHGTLLRTLQTIIEQLQQPDCPASEHLIDSLFGLIAFITSTTPGCNMIVGAGLIPLLVQLVNTCRSDVYMAQRTVSRSIGLIDSVVYSFQPSFQWFVDARGLPTFVARVQHEVENDIRHTKARTMEDGLGALYGKLSFGRASLLRSLLKTLSHMMTSSGNADGLRGLIDSSLLDSIKVIMGEREIFGPQILALAINLVSAFIHNEPTSLGIIQERKIPELFFDLVEQDIEAVSDVMGAIPNAIGAICLNEAGLALFNTRNIITPMFAVFTSARHLRVLLDRDNAAMFGSAMDELIRHQPSLKQRVLDAILGVLDRIQELGLSYTPPQDDADEHDRYSLQMVPELLPLPASTSSADNVAAGTTRSLALGDVVMDESDTLRSKEDDVKGNDVIGFMDVTARFLDGFFQSASHCKDFMKSEGPEKLLRFVSLPCLPYNFPTSNTADSLVSLLRFMTEVSPSAVLAAVLKELHRGLTETQDLWDRDPNVSSVASMLAPSNDAALAAANEKFRKLISLNSRLHLLSDVLPSYAFTGPKTPGAFLQVLQAGVSSPQLGQATLTRLGALHSIVTWENILIKATAPSLPKSPPAADATEGALENVDASRAPQPGLPSNLLEDNAGLVEAREAPEPSSPTTRDQLAKDPRIRNSTALRYVLSQLPVSLSSIFSEATRILTPKRSPDPAQRRTAAQVADSIGKSLRVQLVPPESNNESNNLAFITMMIGHLTNVLYDDRSASVVVHTGVLHAFERAGGVEALLSLYQRYVDQLDAHFAQEDAGAKDSNEASLRLGHLCGGLKVSLNLLQNLSASRPLHDAPATQQMTAKDNPSSADQFKPHELLLRLRSVILPPVQATWNKAWLTQVPLSVNRSVMQTLLHILQAEGEDPPKPKVEATTSHGLSSAGSTQANLGGSASALSNFLGGLGGGLSGTLMLGGGPPGANGSSLARRQPVVVAADESRIQLLTDMGFPRGAARHALSRYGNNANAATEYLLAHPEIVGSMANEPEPEPPAAPAATTPEVAPSASSGEAPSGNSRSVDDTPMASVGGSGNVASPSPADSDTAMREAPPDVETDKSGPSTEVGQDENSSLTSLHGTLKTKLDELRKPLAANITIRGLELADHHETLVFDVKDSICIFADDKEKTSNTLKTLLENIHSVQPTAFASTEVATATRLHLMALIFNEQIVLKSFNEELAQMACNVIGALAAGYEQRPEQNKHPKWLASLCLVASAVLGSEEETLEGRKPDKDSVETTEEPVRKPSRFEAEAHAFYELCMRVLAMPETLANEEMLSVYRLLVLLTRNPHIAASLAKRSGVQTLLRPFLTSPAGVKNCQSYLIICLRHVVESRSQLKIAVQQEVRAWFAQARTQVVDATAMMRGLSQAALRDPQIFMEVVKENVEMADFVVAKGSAALKLISLDDTPAAKGGKDSASVTDADHAGDRTLADETFDAPASPTRGHAELDAQMDDLTKSIKDKDGKNSAGQQHTSSDADAVIHFLLSELLRTSRERLALWSQKKARQNVGGNVSPAAANEKPQDHSDMSSNTADAANGTGDKPAAATTDATPEKSTEDQELDSTYFYLCFLMQCLTELTSSYVACKSSFINCSKKRLAAVASATGKDLSSSAGSVPATPKVRTLPGVTTLFLHELVPSGFVERIDDVEESRRRATISNWAMSSIVALTADVGFHTAIKELSPSLISVRKQILDALARALKDAVASNEVIEVRYGRLYALADLCHRLLTARPNGIIGGVKQSEELTLHIAKTMLEKYFVPLLTSALGDVDLNMPTVQSLLDAILRPLDHLTRIAIRAQSKSERVGRAFAEEEEDEEFLDSMDEETLEEREETPDFYRSSALGMHTGEMGTTQDDSMDEDDEEEMEDDEMGEMDYSDSEDRSDLSDESDEDDTDDEDDNMHDAMVEVIDEDRATSSESGEDDELDELEDDGEDEDEEDGWTDDDSADDHSSGESEEDALDFVVGGDGAEGSHPLHGPYDGLGWDDPEEGDLLEPVDVGGDEDDEDENETEDGNMFEEDNYEEDELDLLQDVGTTARHIPSHDRFGANWSWANVAPGGGRGGATGPIGAAALPPTFFLGPVGPEGAGTGADDGFAGNPAAGNRRPRPRAPPLVNTDPASHPLLDDQREILNQRQASRRSRRAGHSSGYQDWAQSIDELIGGGAIELFDAIFGRGAGGGGALPGPGGAHGGEAEIRIEMATGQGAPHMQITGPFGATDNPALAGIVNRLPAGANARLPTRHHFRRTLTGVPEQRHSDPVAAVHSFRPASTMSRWTDEERIVFGELAPEHSSRLRNHVVNALMPKWKESSSATAKQQQQKGELAEVTNERNRILEELNQIRDRLARNRTEVTDLRDEVARQRGSQDDQDDQSRATEASASAPRATSTATGQEDVEMTESSQQQQPTAQAQAQAEGSDANSQPHLELASLQQGLRDLDSAIAQTGAEFERPEADSTEQPDPSAAAAETTESAAPAREMFSINGREVDITDLGIDREVLDALPEEMQEEVVSQALREHRAATVPGQEETSISPEFLDALPPELRAEVLEQEAAERAQTRREQAAAQARSATDAAAAGAPAATTSRQQQDGANAGSAEQRPPSAGLAGGLTLGRPTPRGADGEDFPGWLRTRTAEDFSRRLASMAQHRRQAGGEAGQNAGSGADKGPPRDAIQLLDSNGIAALIRLLFFPTLNARQSGLHKVLANLSQNSKTRTEILSMLLRILSEGSTDVTAVDRSYASMSARAQGNTPGKPPVKRSTSMGVLQLSQAGGSNTGSAVAPLSRAGEEAPFLIASRSIETLLHLTSSNDQAALYFLREDPRMIKKNKGKEKEKGSAPVNILLGLLEKPSILGNAQVVDSLIALLNTVTKPIPGLAAQAEKDKKAEEEAAAAEAAKKGSEEAGPEVPGPSTTTEAPAVPTASVDSKAPEQDAKEDKDKDATALVATKPPQVAKERLAAVVRPLATAISSKGFQHTLAVASHLASIDSDSRQAVTEALQREATAATAVLSENLDMLLATLPPKKTAEEEEADEKAAQQQQQQRASGDVDVDGGQSESQPRVDRKRITSSALPLLASPASAQARLLRSLRAIEWLHGGR